MGTAAQGMKLQRGDGATPTEGFTDVAEITSISVSGETATIDTTHLASVAREKVAGLPDEGSVSCSGNYLPDDTGHRGIIDDKDAGTSRNYRIVYSTAAGGGHEQFAASVVSYEISGEVDGKLSWSFSLAISGAMSYTAGA